MAENQTITLRCPKCGDKYRFEAPTVMNAGKEEDLPALVKLFESAESGFKKENPFTFMCPRCGHTESSVWPELRVYFPLDLYLQLVNKSVISAWDEPLIADMSWALPIAEELYPQIRIPEGS